MPWLELIRIKPRRWPNRFEVPDVRATALLAVCDALPASQRDHKLALLNRAAAQIKAGRARLLRLYQLGERGRAMV